MKVDVNQDGSNTGGADINSNEIANLEEYLFNFQEEWKETQAIRSSKWRKNFACSFILAILVSISIPTFWWVGLIVITYFAGSLFTLLRQNAKTSHQIIEHKKQLQLVKLLRNFESSPFSQK